MSAVWKFPLVIDGEQKVSMPEGAELLHVAEQFGVLWLWARVSPEQPVVERRSILIRGTGHPIGSEPYIGTVVTRGGALVWHVFDGGSK